MSFQQNLLPGVRFCSVVRAHHSSFGRCPVPTQSQGRWHLSGFLLHFPGRCLIGELIQFPENPRCCHIAFSLPLGAEKTLEGTPLFGRLPERQAGSFHLFPTFLSFGPLTQHVCERKPGRQIVHLSVATENLWLKIWLKPEPSCCDSRSSSLFLNCPFACKSLGQRHR